MKNASLTAFWMAGVSGGVGPVNRLALSAAALAGRSILEAARGSSWKGGLRVRRDCDSLLGNCSKEMVFGRKLYVWSMGTSQLAHNYPALTSPAAPHRDVASEASVDTYSDTVRLVAIAAAVRCGFCCREGRVCRVVVEVLLQLQVHEQKHKK